MLRLDKYLADCGVGTRSEVKKYLRAGRVSVDGSVCTKPETKIDPEQADVTFDGRHLRYRRFAYYMLHKPAGVITATEDTRHRTVLDLMEDVPDSNLSPVGRLDIDTEGLLLITNDGALAHGLLSPAKHVEKTYLCRLAAPATEQDAEAFAEGIVLEDGTRCRPARCEILPDGALVTITEGKYHQVKRMWAARDNEVRYLKRLSMGPLILPDDLPSGAYRELTPEELHQLKDRDYARE